MDQTLRDMERLAEEVRPSLHQELPAFVRKYLVFPEGGWKFILLLVHLHLYYSLPTPIFLYLFPTLLTLRAHL